MADELSYRSAVGESNKRKYDDSGSPVRRRSTGFSSAPESGAPPSSYNSVPPPMNEIEIAKQKAQEIAARLLNSADPTKRARFENGGGGGYDSSDAGMGQKPFSLGLSGPTQGASYGYPSPSKKIDIPNGRVGVIIGKGGETIKYLQMQSGAKIQVTRDTDADPNSSTRAVEISGTPDQVAKAEQLISDVLAEAETSRSGMVSRGFTGQQSGAEQFVMMVPNNKVGLVIGKGGETIKTMQLRTGARIQVIPLHLPPGDMSKERTVQINGTSEQIEAAKQLVNEVTSENRPRNQSTLSGGYSQPGYQAQPPSNWAQPGMQQQADYSYNQQPAYPGYPPYPGYPSQPTSGGYPTSYGQSTVPQNQPPAQGGGYNYYNQQQQAPTDGSGYGYPSGQGYSQDGYGGYQSGYTQPQTNPGSGYEYDQQQQEYNSNYSSNITNPTPEGDTNQSAPAAPAPAPGAPAPVPPSSQGVYGTQPPPVGYGNYGPQITGGYDSQGVSGGYTQQPVYYAQADSGGLRPPVYGGAPPPPYGGVPPAAQPGYGQQQSALYNGGYPQPPTYSGGYSQPPTYASDATSPPKSALPGGGAAKATTP